MSKLCKTLLTTLTLIFVSIQASADIDLYRQSICIDLGTLEMLSAFSMDDARTEWLTHGRNSNGSYQNSFKSPVDSSELKNSTRFVNQGQLIGQHLKLRGNEHPLNPRQLARKIATVMCLENDITKGWGREVLKSKESALKKNDLFKVLARNIGKKETMLLASAISNHDSEVAYGLPGAYTRYQLNNSLGINLSLIDEPTPVELEGSDELYVAP